MASDGVASGNSRESKNKSTIQADVATIPALREDQVANAVAFLTNPKVSAASQEAKTTFLVKKGLTSAEIDEAYRRAPSKPASVASESLPPKALNPQPAPNPPPSVPGQQQLYGQQPQYQPLQTRQPVLQPQGYYLPPSQQTQQLQQQPQQQRTSWSVIAFALTALAAGGYGLQRLLAPYVREYYDRWQSRTAVQSSTAVGQLAAPSTASGAITAMSSAERTAAETFASAIKSQTEELQSTLKELKQVLETFRKESSPGLHATSLEPEDGEDDAATPLETLRSVFRADVRADLRAELRSFALTISELTAGSGDGHDTPAASRYGTPGRATPSRASSPAIADLTAHPGSGAHHAHSNGRMNGHRGGGVGHHADQWLGGPTSPRTQSGGSSVAGDVHSSSAGKRKSPAMADVMAMMQAGVTPPNVRSDIVDMPPDASAALPSSRLTPPLKPWERASSAGALPSRVGVNTQHMSSAPSSVSDIIGTGADVGSSPWKPPPVPQPSIVMPWHRSTNSANRRMSTASEADQSDSMSAHHKGTKMADSLSTRPQSSTADQSDSMSAGQTNGSGTTKPLSQSTPPVFHVEDTPPAFAAAQANNKDGQDSDVDGASSSDAHGPSQPHKDGPNGRAISSSLHAGAPEFKPREFIADEDQSSDDRPFEPDELGMGP